MRVRGDGRESGLRPRVGGCVGGVPWSRPATGDTGGSSGAAVNNPRDPGGASPFRQPRRLGARREAALPGRRLRAAVAERRGIGRTGSLALGEIRIALAASLSSTALAL